MTEDEMVGWLHRLNGHEFVQTQGDSGGQGSLACCCPWGCRESDTTQQLNNKGREIHQFKPNIGEKILITRVRRQAGKTRVNICSRVCAHVCVHVCAHKCGYVAICVSARVFT